MIRRDPTCCVLLIYFTGRNVADFEDGDDETEDEEDYELENPSATETSLVESDKGNYINSI